MRFACWMTKATDTLRKCNTLLFHGVNVYATALQCYVILILHVLLSVGTTKLKIKTQRFVQAVFMCFA
jgi:hypothetical protein